MHARLRRLPLFLRLTAIGVLGVAVAVAIEDRLARPSLTDFDPGRMGRLETAMWRDYYEHRWSSLAINGLRISCGEFGFSFWDGARSSLLAASAARHFSGNTGDPRCLPLLERYYRVVSDALGREFNASEAARLELEWWKERRRKLEPSVYGRTIAANAAIVHGLPSGRLLPSALSRARAMDYRDRHGRKGRMSEENWGEVRQQLTTAYGFLKDAASGASFLENGVTAHRGSSLEHPENTLEAFRHALELGVDWIELDIFTTADGHLVVHHDATTRATSDRDLSIAASTLADLRELDVAHHFRERHGLTRSSCPPATMPLLSEVLDLVITQAHTRLSIQPKDESVDAAIRLIEEKGARDWCGFNDGSLPKMKRVKELAPEIPVFWDRPARIDLDNDLETARACGFESLVIHQDGVDAEVISRVKESRFEVGAWTVNEPARMRELLELGIDRLYTDDPRTMLELISARK
ncbi:MAG: hypothetical protein KDN18_21790 [Verrucomicrobiae bacterium]|nr:hypothetical protein [Verrucomicrobiae bacterium]